MKLSVKNSEGLELPAKKTEHIFWDDDIAGFGLRLRAGGSRNWIFQYRLGGKQRRISFGSASTVTAQKAREKAATLHAQVKLGQDPAGQKTERRARATETFAHILRPYLAHKKSALKPRTYVEVERHLLKNAKRVHGLQIAAIDRRTVAALLTDIAVANGPTAANHVRASLSAFFAWAMREGLAETNPVIGTNRAVENGSRDRVLTDSELRSIWNALGDDDDYGNIVRLLALTGQRRDEIGGLRRSEVDLDEALISLPAERTKNKRPHDVPLSPPALAILKHWLSRRSDDREYVFGNGAKTGYQGWSNSKELLDQRMSEAAEAITDWRLHDLRRTMSTRMHDELGIAPHIVEAVLNHVSGHRAGVAGTYNRALYSKEKAVALASWAEHVTAIVKDRRSKVIAISNRTARS
jgi:integrase